MSKKKRNVFNLPEALYRGILEDVRNDPNLYINPDPTVHEDIHYMAYTLYAQRPSDSELSRNYINALIKVGEVCDEIEHRIGKPIDRKIMDAAKAQVEKDKKARHAKEAEEHKNDKDFFGNPKPYVHKYWKYEEETEDTLALIEMLKAYHSGKMTSSDEDDEEEVVELTKHNKHGKDKKKKAPEPIVEIDEDDDDEDEEDSDEDDDDTPEITIGGFSYDRNRDYRAELAEALDDDDDEDEDDSGEDEEEDDEDDDIPVLRTPSFMKPPVARPVQTPKVEPSDPFAGFECEADDEDDDDLDSVDLESEQAAFDAWVAKQNTDEVVVNMGSLAASSNSHRLADSDDELSDDDGEDEEEEIPDDPYAKVRHLIPAGMEPDDYHRKVLRAVLQASSCWPDKPEKVDIMSVDELFQYYSLKNPEATIKQFKNLPAYAPYLDKYLPGWNKDSAEAPKKDNAPVIKEPAPVKKPVEKVKAEIVEETPIAKPDPNKPMTFAEFDARAKSMVEQAKAEAAQHASDYYKFRAEHPWPVKKSSEVEAEIVEEKPEETNPEELEKDEVTFAGGRLTPEEADAIMDASFGGNEADEDKDEESESDDNGAEGVPYYQIDAFADFESNCDNIVRISDDVNVVSINLDYLDDSDPDVVNRDNSAVNIVVGQYYTSMYAWIQQTLIHYRPSVILTPDEYNSMMSGVETYDPFQYMFFKLGTKYVACYSLTDRFYETIKDLLHYLSTNNQLTSFFKKYTKIVSDIDGFSFVNTNRQYSWMMDNIVNSEMNDSEMKGAFISDFKKDAIYSDPDDQIEPITFNDLDASSITGGDEDKEFYDLILKIIYGITHEIELADDDEDDAEDTPVTEAEVVSEVPSTSSEEMSPNQEMANAANTLFTLTADKKVDLDDVGMVARKLQDFVNKEVAEARGKLNPEELVEDDSDDEVEDDDDIEEEYFPNRRKEVKKTSNPVKKPVQKKNNSDDDPNAFVIQRR